MKILKDLPGFASGVNEKGGENMVKSKKIGSAVMAVMIALNIFAGLAAATPDVYAEPPDVSDSKPIAYTINCPNYGISLVYGADISSNSDEDRFKCSVNSGDKIGQFIESGAYTSGISGYADDQNGNFVELLKYGANDGNGIVPNPPVYSKIYNSKRVPYYGYEFFLARNWP